MKIGVDIGGTKIIAASANDSGKVIISPKITTPHSPAEGLLAINQLITSLCGKHQPSSIAIVCPGPLDFSGGVILTPPNLPWHHFPIISNLAKTWPAPINLENDANAAALAEWRNGAGIGSHSLLYVTLSTGIGTGVIFDGHIYHGAHDTEGGHIYISHGKHLQTLEDTVSGLAILKRFGKIAADIDDPQIWDTIARDLAIGLSNMILMLSPDRIVLGGGVSVHFDKFQHLLMRHLESFKQYYPLPTIVQAKFQETAAVMGALILAEENTAH